MRERIRVLHIVGTGGTGGVESFVATALRHVDAKRFELSVCVTGEDGPMRQVFREAGAMVTVLRSPGRLGAVAALRLVRLLSSPRYDIVHMHTGGRTLKSLVRWAHRGAIIQHVHGMPDEGLVALRTGSDIPPGVLAPLLSGRPDRVLCCSQQIAGALAARVPAPRRNTIAHLRHGIDLRRFDAHAFDSARALHARTELGLAPSDLVLGFVGRLVAQKGIAELASVMERLSDLPRARLVVVGEGPERTRLQALAQSLGHGRVVMLGEQVEVERWLPAFDMLLLTSRWEPFGLVLLEAMASGRPVVAFDVDGVREAIGPAACGVRVEPGNVDAIAAAIRSLAADAQARRTMGLEGRARTERLFDAAHMASRLQSHYEELLFARTSAPNSR